MNNRARVPAGQQAGKGRLRRVLAMAAIALGCIAVDNIYALFGHGVRSPAMSLMFLYPLGAGMLYLLLGLVVPQAFTGGWGRLGVNLVGSGVATLTVGAFLTGILEIAGSSSAYAPFFPIVGWIFAALGTLCLLIAAVRQR